MTVRFFLFITLFTVRLTVSGQQLWQNDPYPLHRAQKALTDVMVHDIFSPPVASRIYVYANVAGFEVLATTQAVYRSLYGQVNDFPAIPAPHQRIEPSLASVYAFLFAGEKLIFSEGAFKDSIASILSWYKGKGISKQVYKNSIRYGQQVAELIGQWASKDFYRETRSMRRYSIKKEEGNWIPTPPGYMAAVEPYWEKIRTVAVDSARQFKPPAPFSFSKDPDSDFYKEAYEVYERGKQLSNEDSAIASFWDCNPFFINTTGHLNFATKKISPGGHWMLIAGLSCRTSNADLAKTAATYTYTAIALFDAFICCWAEKYRSNVIRPETYINAYIDENWRPILQTPPFPEYNSGHSVVSAAAATVLTYFLGENFSFEDDTEVEFGLPVRSFKSFMQASEEAGISRLYGGIHYRAAIENGQEQGRKVGEWVWQKIKLTK